MLNNDIFSSLFEASESKRTKKDTKKAQEDPLLKSLTPEQKVLAKRDEARKYVAKIPGSPDSLSRAGEPTFMYSNKATGKLAVFLTHTLNYYINSDPAKFNTPGIQDIKKIIAVDSQDAYSSAELSDKVVDVDYSYGLFLGLLLPYLKPEVSTALFQSDAALEVLNTISETYTGSLIGSLEFISTKPIIFSSFDHIQDPIAKFLLQRVHEILLDKTQNKQYKDFSHLVDIFNNQFNRSITNSTIKSKLTRAELNNIAKSVYYELIAGIAPHELDMFLLDPEKLLKLSTNPKNIKTLAIRGGDRSYLLDDDSESILRARLLLAEQDPALNRGLIGNNARKTLNFTYAKESGILSRKKEEKVISGIEQQKSAEAYALSLAEPVKQAVEEFTKLLEKQVTQITSAPTEALTKEAFTELKKQLDLKSDEIISAAETAPSLQMTSVSNLPLYTNITLKFAGVKELTVDELSILLTLAGTDINNYDISLESLSQLSKNYKALQEELATSASISHTTIVNFLTDILKSERKISAIDRKLSFSDKEFKSTEALEPIENIKVSSDETKIIHKRIEELQDKIAAANDHLNDRNITHTPEDNAKVESDIAQMKKEMRQLNADLDITHEASLKPKLSSSTQDLLYAIQKELSVASGPKPKGEKPTKEELSLRASLKSLRDIKQSRYAAYDYITALKEAPKSASSLFNDLRTAILEAPEDIRSAMLYSSNDQDAKKVSDFLHALLNEKIDFYFKRSENEKDLLTIKINNLSFLLPGSASSVQLETAKKNILATLESYAKTGSLATDVIINSSESLVELDPKLIQFINLAASIKVKDKHAPTVTVDKNGMLIPNFALIPTKGFDDYYNAYLQLRKLPLHVKSSPIASLAYQRLFLRGLINPLQDLASSVDATYILSEATVKAYPRLTASVTKFLGDLKSGIHSLDTRIVPAIESAIINQFGGTEVSLYRPGSEKPIKIAIPKSSKGPEFAAAMRQLVHFEDLGGMNKSTQLKFAEDSINSITNEIGRETVVEKLKQALIVIGTGINLQIAYSISEDMPKELIEKIKATSDDVSEEVLSKIVNATKEDTTKFFDRFKEETGLINVRPGASPKSYALSYLVLGFNAREDRLQAMRDAFDAQKLYDDLQTGNLPRVSFEELIKELGMVYLLTGEVKTSDLWSLEKESAATVKESVEASDAISLEEAIEPPTGPAPQPSTEPADAKPAGKNIIIINKDGVGTVNAEQIQNSSIEIKKDLFNRISGITGTTLGKGQRPGENVRFLMNYSSDLIPKLRSSVDSLYSKYIAIYKSNKNDVEAEELHDNHQNWLHNCKQLLAFFESLRNNSTAVSSFNTAPSQNYLLGLLKDMKPITTNSAAAKKIYGLVTQDKKLFPKKSQEVLNAVGIARFFSLIGDYNQSIQEVKQSIIEIIKKDGDTLNAIADRLQASGGEGVDVSIDKFKLFLHSISTDVSNASKDLNMLATLVDLKTIKSNILPPDIQIYVKRLLRGLSKTLPAEIKAKLEAGIGTGEFTNQIYGNKVTEINPEFELESLDSVIAKLESALIKKSVPFTNEMLIELASLSDSGLYSYDPALNTPHIKSRVKNLWANLPEDIKKRVTVIRDEKDKNKEPIYRLEGVSNKATNIYTKGLIGSLDKSLFESVSYAKFIMESLVLTEAGEAEIYIKTKELAAQLYKFKNARVVGNDLIIGGKLSFESLYADFLWGLPLIALSSAPIRKALDSTNDVATRTDANIFKVSNKGTETEIAVKVFDFNSTKALVDRYFKATPMETNEKPEEAPK